METILLLTILTATNILDSKCRLKTVIKTYNGFMSLSVDSEIKIGHLYARRIGSVLNTSTNQMIYYMELYLSEDTIDEFIEKIKEEGWR